MKVTKIISKFSNYRRRYERELSIMNIIGISALSIYLFIECGINKKDKYKTLQSLKTNLDALFGKKIHRFIVLPFLMVLHFIFTITFLTNIFLTDSLAIFVINVSLLTIVAMLNLMFKGCIAHKYEKLMLKKYVKLVTFFELFFIPYNMISNKPLSLAQKISFVYFFYSLIFVITGLRFLSLLTKQNNKNVL